MTHKFVYSIRPTPRQRCMHTHRVRKEVYFHVLAVCCQPVTVVIKFLFSYNNSNHLFSAADYSDRLNLRKVSARVWHSVRVCVRAFALRIYRYR